MKLYFGLKTLLEFAEFLSNKSELSRLSNSIRRKSTGSSLEKCTCFFLALGMLGNLGTEDDEDEDSPLPDGESIEAVVVVADEDNLNLVTSVCTESPQLLSKLPPSMLALVRMVFFFSAGGCSLILSG